MECSSIGLTSEWMKSIPSQSIEKDFEFVVNGQSILWNSVLACMLSPKIARLRSGDTLTNRLVIKTTDEKGLFSQVLYLTLGRNIDIRDASEAAFFVAIAQELENKNLCGNILRRTGKELTVETCIDRLKKLSTYGVACDEELEFIAAHFYELDKERLKEIHLDLLNEILFSDSLVVESEDSLYEFVADLFTANPNDQDVCFRMFGALWFDCLSLENVQAFCKICGHFLHDMDSIMWEHLSRRLCHNVAVDRNDAMRKRYRHAKTVIEYNGSNSLSGIIHHLSNQCGGNVHDKRVVNITSGTPYSSSPAYVAKNVADVATNSFFQSVNSEYTFVCYDFKEKTIIPTYYSIRTCNGGAGDFHWRSWVIETSTDGKSWSEVDRRDNNPDFNAANVTKTYPISVQKECRMFRIRQTGPNWNGTNYINFSALEVFGSLIQAS